MAIIMEEIKIKEMTTGERVRLLRERFHLLQKELASRAGLSVQTICNLENGKARPSVSTIKKIAEVLNVPPTVFFEDELRQKKLLRNELRKKMTQIEKYVGDGEKEKGRKLLDEVLGLFKTFGEEIHQKEEDKVTKAIFESSLPEASKEILLYLYRSLDKNK
jgi:transcriptional regulator with XRE-family HTH domain